MKIAIPLSNGRLTDHFGHCQEFAFVDVDPAERRILSATQRVPPPHEPGVLPRWLGEQGVDVVIAGGMGRRALALFGENGIQVVLGAPADTPQSLVEGFLDGSLRLGGNACDHGGSGDGHGGSVCRHSVGSDRDTLLP